MKNTLTNIKRYLDILLISQYYEWKSDLIYRLQFVISILQTFLYVILNFVFITVIYSVSNGIAGWNYYQLLMFSASAGIITALIAYFVSTNGISDALKYGYFDVLLTKPYNPLFLLIARSQSLTQTSSIFWNIILFSYAAYHLSLGLSGLIPFVVFLLLGGIVFSSFIIFLVTLSYKVFTTSRWVSRIQSLVTSIGSYPLTIYGVIGVLIFTLAIPIGLATYYPVQVFMGRINYQSFVLILILEIVFIVIFSRLFTELLKSYTSAMG